MNDVPLQPHERLYVLRIWIDDGGAWRASVKNLRTKEPRYFGTVDGLVRFIAQTSSQHPGFS